MLGVLPGHRLKERACAPPSPACQRARDAADVYHAQSPARRREEPHDRSPLSALDLVSGALERECPAARLDAATRSRLEHARVGRRARALARRDRHQPIPAVPRKVLRRARGRLRSPCPMRLRAIVEELRLSTTRVTRRPLIVSETASDGSVDASQRMALGVGGRGRRARASVCR